MAEADLSKTRKAKLEKRMQRILDKLGIPLKVSWIPNPQSEAHGIIEKSSRTIILFDMKEEDAWQTFTHEILEFKLKETLKTYRMVINGLIEIIEKTCYKKKEQFLESVPQIFNLIEEEKRIEQK